MKKNVKSPRGDFFDSHCITHTAFPPRKPTNYHTDVNRQKQQDLVYCLLGLQENIGLQKEL